MRKWTRNWIVLAAIVIHGTWGIILLFGDSPLHTTPMGHFAGWNRYAVSFLYLFASTMALIPVVVRRLDSRFTGLVLTLLQQWLMLLSFGTSTMAAINGRYPDGYVPSAHGNPHLFIFVDQLPLTVCFVCHTLSLLDWYWWSRR